MVRCDPDLRAVLDARPDMEATISAHMDSEFLWISNIAYDMAFDDLMADEPATKDET